MWGRRSTVSRRRWPELEQLEDRLTPAAVRPVDTFSNTTLFRTDDGSSAAVALGFTLNFFGVSESSLFVNNNGNVTFDGPLSTFTPFGLSNPQRQIIAPFFADVDTRDPSSNPDRNNVTYGSGTLDGRNAFQVTWDDVGYFSTRVNRLNTFQLLLIERADRAEGDFDIEFNYDRIEWETGQASGGDTVGQGGSSARVGYANNVNNPTFFELAGSGVPGSFLDGNAATGLTTHSLNSDVPGRYVLEVRSGTINRPPQFDNLPDEITLRPGVDAFSFDVDASDPDEDALTYALVEPVLTGITIDADTGLIDLAQLPGGEHTQVVAVSDGSNTIQATLSIAVLNAPPTFDNLPTSLVRRSGVADQFVVRATDPEGQPLTFSPVAFPPWASMDATGLISFTPPSGEPVSLTVRVDDGLFGAAEAQLTVVANDPPTLDNLPARLTFLEGPEPGTFDVAASDPENDVLVFSLPAAPAGVAIDPATGVLSFPVRNGPAEFTIVVGVDDGRGVVRGEFTVRVENVAPTFEAGGNVLLVPGQRLVRPLSFVDPGQDVWTIEVDYFGTGAFVPIELGPGQTFQLDAEQFPRYLREGSFDVTIRIGDGAATAQDGFRVTVLTALTSIAELERVSVRPGEEPQINLLNPDGSEQAALLFGQDAGATSSATVLLIEYSDNPRATVVPADGEFLDVNISGESSGSTASLRFTPRGEGQRFAVFFLNETVEPPVQVLLGFFTRDENGQLTIDLNALLEAELLGNTVFTVSLVKPVTQTGTVTGPTAQAGTGDRAALSQSATFISQTQLSLGVTTAQARQLAPAGTARGVTTTGAPGLGSAFSASSGDDTDAEADGTGIAFVGDEPGQRGRPRPWWALWHEDGDPLPIRETKVAPAVEDKVPTTPTTDPQRGDELQPERKDDDRPPRDEPSALLPPAVDCYFGDALPALAAVLPAVAMVRETHRRPRGKRRRLW